MTVGADLDAILTDHESRIAALEGGDTPDPPDPPPVDGPLPVADQRAVDRMRRGRQIQLVPKVDGWRVDYRTPDNEAVPGLVMPTIAGALAAHGDLPRYLKVPNEGGLLEIVEQNAINALAAFARPGRQCSVRWEKNGTHADTNWAGASSWKKMYGLIVEPVDWLASVW